ncbi:MAG: serine hydrolase domain-containing protein, partial [Frankia sp.]
MELEGVHAAFGEVAAGAGEGAAVAVSVDGELVVDEWGGSVDPAGRRGWKRDTLVQVFSVTKPLAATALLLLVDRGFVELDAPARRYWPELIAGATVRQLLAHQAGLPVFDTDVTPEILLDPDAAARLLAAQAPRWEPGTAHGEHALTYGYLVGEIVRRVDGRRLGRFFAEEIAGPHGLDLAIGLNPAQQARCADLRALPASGASPPGPDPASPASPARRDPHPDPDL